MLYVFFFTIIKSHKSVFKTKEPLDEHGNEKKLFHCFCILSQVLFLCSPRTFAFAHKELKNVLRVNASFLGGTQTFWEGMQTLARERKSIKIFPISYVFPSHDHVPLGAP